MEDGRPKSYLFCRMMAVLQAVVLLASMVYAATTSLLQGDLDVVKLFLLVLVSFACLGIIWFCVTWRTRTVSELEEEEEVFPAPETPEIPPGAIVCKFSAGRKLAAIYIDRDANLLYFKNCFQPRRFLSWTQSWHTAPIADLKAVHRYVFPGEDGSYGPLITIVTAQGKAVLPEGIPNASRVLDYLAEHLPKNQAGFEADHPGIGMTQAGGAVVGVFLGWYSTPENASDATLGLYILGGAVLGAAVSYLLVVFFDKWLNISLFRPLRDGLAGALVGVLLVNGFRIGGNWQGTFVVAVTLGAISGFAFGLWRQARNAA